MLNTMRIRAVLHSGISTDFFEANNDRSTLIVKTTD
jgi:hypothetical protein